MRTPRVCENQGVVRASARGFIVAGCVSGGRFGAWLPTLATPTRYAGGVST